VEGNGEHGIILFTINVTKMLVTKNIVVNNGIFDLADANPNCGTNRWRNSAFRIANQACIDVENCPEK